MRKHARIPLVFKILKKLISEFWLIVEGSSEVK